MAQEKQGKSGPEPDRVKSNRPWEDSVKDALQRKRPEGGWPKPEKDKKPE